MIPVRDIDINHCTYNASDLTSSHWTQINISSNICDIHIPNMSQDSQYRSHKRWRLSWRQVILISGTPGRRLGVRSGRWRHGEQPLPYFLPHLSPPPSHVTKLGVTRRTRKSRENRGVGGGEDRKIRFRRVENPWKTIRRRDATWRHNKYYLLQQTSHRISQLRSKRVITIPCNRRIII